jgi:class 3 adenylate cyclase
MRDLPSGTVTFLLTDIEGSTRLLREGRERYREILTEHGRILRSAIEEHGGREIDTQGDSFFAAFPTAKNAVDAAVAAQRALASHPWGDGEGPRVRMGMHTGEPSVAGDRYVGLAVHRAARICSAAHGGQVLLSSTTSDLVADELSPEVGLRNLGEHKLKDFDRPERVFQLDVDGLPAEFPPLTTSELPAAAEPSRRRLWQPLFAFGPWPWLLGIGIAVVVPLVSILRGGGEEARPAALVPSRSLAVIDPKTNEVAGSLRLEGSPSGLAYGEDTVWVMNASDRTLVGVDAQTRKRVGTVGLGARPAAVATTPGAVWVLAAGLSAPLLRVVPGTNQVLEVARPECCDGFGLMAASDQELWVSATDGTRVQRYDVEAGELSAALCCSVQPDALALGEDALWAIERYDEQVARLDAETGSIQAEIRFGAPRPPGLNFSRNPIMTAAVAGEGALWIADLLDGVVWQIDARTNSVKRTIDVGGAGAIDIGAGSVWVANRVGGTVSRIDPESGRIVKRIKVAKQVGDLVAGKGVIWVTVP